MKIILGWKKSLSSPRHVEQSWGNLKRNINISQGTVSANIYMTYLKYFIHIPHYIHHHTSFWCIWQFNWALNRISDYNIPIASFYNDCSMCIYVYLPPTGLLLITAVVVLMVLSCDYVSHCGLWMGAGHTNNQSLLGITKFISPIVLLKWVLNTPLWTNVQEKKNLV